VLEFADDGAVEELAVVFGSFGEFFGGLGAELLHELDADSGAFSQKPLRILLDLLHLAQLPGGVVGVCRREQLLGNGQVAGCGKLEIGNHCLQRRLQCFIAAVVAAAVGSSDDFDCPGKLAAKFPGALDFTTHDIHRWGAQLSRRSAIATDRDLRPARHLDGQRARHHHACEFGVAELLDKAENVPVDRLLPEEAGIAEIAAGAGGFDSLVEGAGEEGDHPAFAPAHDGDVVFILREPIDGGHYLLHFVADDVAAQFERGAIQELAAGELGAAVARFHFAIDQNRHDHAAAIFGEAAGEL
jgi:hypothetical protein